MTIPLLVAHQRHISIFFFSHFRHPASPSTIWHKMREFSSFAFNFAPPALFSAMAALLYHSLRLLLKIIHSHRKKMRFQLCRILPDKRLSFTSIPFGIKLNDIVFLNSFNDSVWVFVALCIPT